MRNFFKLHPAAAAILIVDLIVVIILIIIVVVKELGKNANSATIDVVLAPATAKVEINGTEYVAGPYGISPGEVTAVISADGFKTKTINLTLTSGFTTKIHDYLEPNDDNLNYYARDEASFSSLKSVGSEGSRKLVKTISIRDELPFTYFEYGGLDGESFEVTVNEDAVCDQTFCLLSIGDTTENHARTKKMIEEKGYNPDDYKIRYKND